MALGNLFGLVGAGLAKAATNTIADTYKKKQNTSTNQVATTNKNTTYKTPSYNEHQQYIQDTHPGGYDAYTKLQNDRYTQAIQDNNIDLLKNLQTDSQRVGYKLTNNQQAVQPPIMPQTDYTQQMNDLLSAVKTYQSNIPDIPYPDMSDYNFGNIQKQLGNLTNQVQNYQGAKYMNMDEAIARANSQLGGMYNESMNKAIDNYNKNAIARGMYGQMPVEALKQNAMAENELNKANAVNSYGADLYSKDFNMAQQKNNNYYAQINRLADLLGQQYNTELGQYQSDVNRYTNTYNMARQQDNDYFDNIYRQLDILGNQYDMQNNEMDRYVNNIGQFSNDYMAEINKVKGDNNPSNDWQIAYLQNARNQKISGQNQSQSEAQSQTYKQAMDMFGKLGYASGWVAQALGLPEGTTTASYANSLRSRNGGTSNGGSGGGTSEIPTPESNKITLTPAQMENYIKLATETLENEKGYYSLNGGQYDFIKHIPTRDEILRETSKILKALGYDNASIDKYLASSNPSSYFTNSDDTSNNLYMGDFKRFDKNNTNYTNLMDILKLNGMLQGNDQYSTQFDLDMINWLNGQN